MKQLTEIQKCFYIDFKKKSSDSEGESLRSLRQARLVKYDKRIVINCIKRKSVFKSIFTILLCRWKIDYRQCLYDRQLKIKKKLKTKINTECSYIIIELPSNSEVGENESQWRSENQFVPHASHIVVHAVWLLSFYWWAIASCYFHILIKDRTAWTKYGYKTQKKILVFFKGMAHRKILYHNI